jgi:hypothetical protein
MDNCILNYRNKNINETLRKFFSQKDKVEKCGKNRVIDIQEYFYYSKQFDKDFDIFKTIFHMIFESQERPLLDEIYDLFREDQFQQMLSMLRSSKENHPIRYGFLKYHPRESKLKIDVPDVKRILQIPSFQKFKLKSIDEVDPSYLWSADNLNRG